MHIRLEPKLVPAIKAIAAEHASTVPKTVNRLLFEILAARVATKIIRENKKR